MCSQEWTLQRNWQHWAYKMRHNVKQTKEHNTREAMRNTPRPPQKAKLRLCAHGYYNVLHIQKEWD